MEQEEKNEGEILHEVKKVKRKWRKVKGRKNMREKRGTRERVRGSARMPVQVGGKIREIEGRKGIWEKTLRKRESEENECLG